MDLCRSMFVWKNKQKNCLLYYNRERERWWGGGGGGLGERDILAIGEGKKITCPVKRQTCNGEKKKKRSPARSRDRHAMGKKITCPVGQLHHQDGLPNSRVYLPRAVWQSLTSSPSLSPPSAMTELAALVRWKICVKNALQCVVTERGVSLMSDNDHRSHSTDRHACIICIYTYTYLARNYQEDVRRW